MGAMQTEAAHLPSSSYANKMADPHKEQNQGPLPPVTNAPEQILSAWTALEVLSPPSFLRPEDLAGGDRKAVAALNEPALPWERAEKSRPKYKLYYQVVLGSMKMEPAIERLIERFGDARPGAKGRAVLAVVIVDRQGRLVQSPAIAISSFAMPRAAAACMPRMTPCAWPLRTITA